MKLIDKIIKILINFKYKREPFLAWSWRIDNINEINILSAEYHDDHYRYGTREEYYKTESEIHCNFTDSEIAKSFIEDVEAVKDFLPREESEGKE